ncbi:unnamed protein product, partial [Arabidopsis halleri]
GRVHSSLLERLSSKDGDSGLSESEVIGEDKFKIRQRKSRRRKRRESFQLKRKSKKKSNDERSYLTEVK